MKFADSEHKYIALVYGEDILLIDPRAFSLSDEYTYLNGETTATLTTPYYQFHIGQPCNVLFVNLDKVEQVGYMRANFGWPNMLEDMIMVGGFEDHVWFERKFACEAKFTWTEEVYPKVFEAVRKIFQ